MRKIENVKYNSFVIVFTLGVIERKIISSNSISYLKYILFYDTCPCSSTDRAVAS